MPDVERSAKVTKRGKRDFSHLLFIIRSSLEANIRVFIFVSQHHLHQISISSSFQRLVMAGGLA